MLKIKLKDYFITRSYIILQGKDSTHLKVDSNLILTSIGVDKPQSPPKGIVGLCLEALLWYPIGLIPSRE